MAVAVGELVGGDGFVRSHSREAGERDRGGGRSTGRVRGGSRGVVALVQGVGEGSRQGGGGGRGRAPSPRTCLSSWQEVEDALAPGGLGRLTGPVVVAGKRSR